jgi:hypothetical protein
MKTLTCPYCHREITVWEHIRWCQKEPRLGEGKK